MDGVGSYIIFLLHLLLAKLDPSNLLFWQNRKETPANVPRTTGSGFAAVDLRRDACRHHWITKKHLVLGRSGNTQRLSLKSERWVWLGESSPRDEEFTKPLGSPASESLTQVGAFTKEPHSDQSVLRFSVSFRWWGPAESPSGTTAVGPSDTS